MNETTSESTETVDQVGDTSESMKVLIRKLMDRLDAHITESGKRTKHLDSLLQEIRIYNRGGRSWWLVGTLITMGSAHLGTAWVLIYLLRHLK